MLNESNQNPLNPSAEEQALIKRRKLDARAADARTADEWFDIFEQIVRDGVMSTAKAHGDAEKGEHGLADNRPYLKHVRHVISLHGLSLSEDVDMEGPVPLFGQNNVMVGVEWPNGQYVKLFWQDKSMLEFRGQNALVAFAFMSWWGTFRQPYEMLTGKQENQERRVIMPGSPDWMSYLKGRPKGL